MTTTDCLIIGFNDLEFASYERMIRSMGRASGAYRDLDLAFIWHGGRPLRSMDVLNHFFAEGRKPSERPFSNADFLWPVILRLGTHLSRCGVTFDYINLFHLQKEQ